MPINYKTVESLEKPSDIDLTSSSDGVYVRRNIKEIVLDDGIKKYYYEEALISQNEYETYSKDVLVGQIKDEDNTAEYEEYKTKLNTGVLYKNGKKYKPKWTKVYFEKAQEIMTMLQMRQAMIALQAQSLNEEQETSADEQLPDISTLKINIYDETAAPENAVQMTPFEISNLWWFLMLKQEEFFNEYKASLNN